MDVQVLAATNRDLEKMVLEGTFREDLYHRLNVLKIEIAPLRERPEDIEPIAQMTFDRLGDVVVGPGVMDLLRRCSWPGNGREVDLVIEQYCAVHGQVLEAHILESYLPCDVAPAAETSGPRDPGKKEKVRAALQQTNGNFTKAAEMLDQSRQATSEFAHRHHLVPVRT